MTLGAISEATWLRGGKYFYSITGSPLSGSNSSAFWNNKEGFSYDSTHTFLAQIRSALDVFRHGKITQDCSTITTITTATKQTPSDLTIFDLVNLLS